MTSASRSRVAPWRCNTVVMVHSLPLLIQGFARLGGGNGRDASSASSKRFPNVFRWCCFAYRFHHGVHEEPRRLTEISRGSGLVAPSAAPLHFRRFARSAISTLLRGSSCSPW